MNNPIRSACLLLAIALPLLSLAPAAGAAQVAMDSSTMTCSKGDAMMLHPAAAMPIAKPSGDIDRDFVQAMMMQHDVLMALVKNEIACGKNAKTKAMAQKIHEKDTVDFEELRLVMGAGG